MKLVIDIDEDYYKIICKRVEGNKPYHSPYEYEVIADGKPLEQEPQSFKWCTDCKEYDQEKHCCHRYSKVIRDTVEEMKQEPKTGHWIEDAEQHHVEKTYHCSECGHGVWGEYEKTEYCGGCGANMAQALDIFEQVLGEVEDGNDNN